MAAAAAVTGGLTDVRKLSVSELPPSADTIFTDLLKSLESNPPHKLTVSKYSAPASSSAVLASDPNKMFTTLTKATVAKINIQVKLHAIKACTSFF